MAVQRNYKYAMSEIANMYEEQEKYDLAEKYYLMAISNNNKDAMDNLADLYDKQNNYKLSEK